MTGGAIVDCAWSEVSVRVGEHLGNGATVIPEVNQVVDMAVPVSVTEQYCINLTSFYSSSFLQLSW
jgi:hypothetical protein